MLQTSILRISTIILFSSSHEIKMRVVFEWNMRVKEKERKEKKKERKQTKAIKFD